MYGLWGTMAHLASNFHSNPPNTHSLSTTVVFGKTIFFTLYPVQDPTVPLRSLWLQLNPLDPPETSLGPSKLACLAAKAQRVLLFSQVLEINEAASKKLASDACEPLPVSTKGKVRKFAVVCIKLR